MRYVPNLIPQTSKVLPDYFKGDVYHPRQESNLLNVIGWILGILFLIGAVVSIKHPVMTLLFGLLGFMLLPPGHRWIEKKLRFRFKTKIKSVAVAGLFIAAIPLTSHYSAIDKREAYEQQLREEKEKQEKLEAERRDQQRRDSLNFYIQASDKLEKAHKTDEAIKKLDYALAFASTETDKDLIAKERTGVLAIKTFDLVKAGKYKAAIPELNNLLQQDPNNADVLYNRALCYSKTGKTQEAVTDLKSAMQFGNADAEKLHNKINPIKKRVVGYVTRCCDGSTSYARGRGACSHHGGVCNWNEPVYEEYRKYD